ncbi:MAG: UvrD-helicase domain-containing protein [Pseudomonadales bacterium]|nr:UvrD-helicase domain-containing protein [Pseudomonadales bacterium]
MYVLIYNELKLTNKVKKVIKLLEADDFRSAEVKKLADNLFRAKVDYAGRLIFSFYRYQQETYCLLLEFLPNHEYHKSRFLRQVTAIDDDKIPLLTVLPKTDQCLPYINPNNKRFNLLDKIISLDDEQHDIHDLQPPLIIIGSAGSGKTALSLEKMKHAIGDVLYISHSNFLVQNSRELYYSFHYDNENQNIDFLSFHEFIEQIKVPLGKEVNAKTFETWFARNRQQSKLDSAHKVFEEFKGVLTGSQIRADSQPQNTVEENSPWGTAWLSREEYLSLGVKQSIFNGEERKEVYALFEKYLKFLQQTGHYDTNILSHHYLSLAKPRYDFVVVDEVQDLTAVQLFLILQTLHNPTEFILCGDSNQIVHPNFFSWSKIKTLFYHHGKWQQNTDLLRILNSNYRNSVQVTAIANRILKIKQARFGSIDKESNYLVKSVAERNGTVTILNEQSDSVRELNRKTAKSTQFAVLVMHADQKKLAKTVFNTPLVFSVQEAKGLEYENIILYNFVSDEEKTFRDIIQGIEDIDFSSELIFSRNKDKHDKSAEVYKFYINSLYVAITRAVTNLYIIEHETKHRLFPLLGISESTSLGEIESNQSSLEDWQKEARKLELQGKTDQANDIRERLLHQKPVPWPVYTRNSAKALCNESIEKNNKKQKLLAAEYAVFNHAEHFLDNLSRTDFKPARNPEKCLKQAIDKHCRSYTSRNPAAVLRDTEQYGIDHRNVFNFTPLMTAAVLGNETLVTALLDLGSDKSLVQNTGLTAFLLALQQTARDDKYAQKTLPKVFHLLQPATISIQVDGHLIKVDNHHMEFMMFHMAVLLTYNQLGKAIPLTSGLQSRHFVEALNKLSDNLVPERRKRQSYVSGMLSKNEHTKEDRYNRKIFQRIRRGHYILNPQLLIKQADEWVPIYDYLDLNYIYCPPAEKLLYGQIPAGNSAGLGRSREHNEMTKKALDEFKGRVKAVSQNQLDKNISETIL